jgi:hypothetical protein
VLATVTLCILVIDTVISLRNGISRADSNAVRTIFTGLASIQRLFSSTTGLELFDSEINWAYEQASELHSTFVEFSRSILISFTVGTALSIVLFFVMWIVLLLDLRVHVMEARRGRWRFDRSKVRIADASNYLGLQISNSLVRDSNGAIVAPADAACLSTPFFTTKATPFGDRVRFLIVLHRSRSCSSLSSSQSPRLSSRGRR